MLWPKIMIMGDYSSLGLILCVERHINYKSKRGPKESRFFCHQKLKIFKRKRILKLEKECKFKTGWCKTCGKSEGQGRKLCFYEDPYWADKGGFITPLQALNIGKN